MLADDIKIVNISEQRTYDQALQATVAIRVEFIVGRHGPFVEKFPKDAYSAVARDLRLNELAQEYRT